jgi:hypothetical protein
MALKNEKLTQAKDCNSRALSDIKPESRREVVLAALREAVAEMQYGQVRLESIGVSLRHRLITPEKALSWVDEVGATPLVEVTLKRAASKPEPE